MLFEKASRAKLRFESGKGLITAEDLWDMPLGSLDKIAIALSKQLKEGDVESFVTRRKKLDETTQLKFDVAKHIIDVRVAESAAADARAQAKAKKERIMEIMARKQDAALEATSLGELEKMLADL